MTRLFAALLAAAGSVRAGTVLSSFHEGNSLFLRLSDGTAQVDWLSDSSFHFARRWDGNFVRSAQRTGKAVDFKSSDTPQSLQIKTQYLTLTISKAGALLRVAEPDGTPIMTDITEAERRNGVVIWERTAGAETRFFGLGAREDGVIELRGTRTAALKPFLLSTAGYGESHVAPGHYIFDLARAKKDRYRIEAHGADRVEYNFFFGPGPKEVFEQALLADGPIERLSPEIFRPLTASELPAAAIPLKSTTQAAVMHTLINGSLSGLILPAVPIDTNRPLSSIMPIVFGPRSEPLRGALREKLTDYFTVYMEEARDRGLPFVRALAMQYPKDAEAAKVNDEFMLGDELLVAPVTGASKSRTVYLPMGVWTRLSDDRVFTGKRTVTIEIASGEVPLFSRNGVILPLGSNPRVLHYFPKLGAEFFFFETELEDYSQVHAAPAGVFMRLEIESRKDCEYEWVVHHIDRPSGVEGHNGDWSYDAETRQLRVRTHARAEEDQIINVSF